MPAQYTVPQAPPAVRPSPEAAQSLRPLALAALCTTQPEAKVQATHALWAALQGQAVGIDPAVRLSAPASASLPGRPDRPALIPPMQVPHRSPYTAEGLAALVHAICHIEFNAIKININVGIYQSRAVASQQPSVDVKRCWDRLI